MADSLLVLRPRIGSGATSGTVRCPTFAVPPTGASSARGRRRAIASAAALAACLALSSRGGAQVTVRDSLGAPVPYAILESPAGRRVIAGPDGIAQAVSAAEGPWAARRIGYRAGIDTDGDGRIVLARIPIPLAPREVRVAAACTRETVALAAPGENLVAIRAMLTEWHDRRSIAIGNGQAFTYRVVLSLIAEDGREYEGGVDTVALQPAGTDYVPGRAIERDAGEWMLHRPRFIDVASDRFLSAHCVAVDAGVIDGTVVLRFEPAQEVAGPNVIGAYVLERATGRLLSDTLQYVSPPRGAPGQPVLVSTYAAAGESGDPMPGPTRIVERTRPSDLRVRLGRDRVRISETVRVYERLPTASPAP